MSDAIMDHLERALNAVDIAAQAPPANQQILEQLEAQPDRAIMDVLRDQGIPNPSVSYLDRLMKDLSIHKCNSCAFHGEDLSDLRKHIKDEKHQYGQEKLRKEKQDLVDRVNERTQSEYEFKDLYHRSNLLTLAEVRTLNGLIFASVYCVRLKGRR